ncbi:heterokaryon incompatibility het-6 [Fusarium sporotrichioides]|uniref:Heterokaryon incompatibility het-6 n=1 Tax=Fusarium sporotrichioides TaxID=5514 RepID=A0A395S0L2_FUSSP|nr:heterokaryon incompatibility het-6 [Fusarium sporotrichioides]
MRSFRYSHVLSSDLRLLELNPGEPKDPLTGAILHRTFQPKEGKVPEFDAISYCWGDQSQPDSIALSQENHAYLEQSFQNQSIGHLPIGRNLAAALRALRHPQRKRLLWCDSICIDQNDLHDRAVQVQKMHHIYCYALCVIVWLGPETSWSALAMDTLRSCSELVESVTMDYSVVRQFFTFKDPAHANGGLAREGLPLNMDQWRAIEEMLALDWHKRLWTHQEVVLANKQTCIVMLGHEEITWKQFHDAVSIICFLTSPPSHAINNLAAYSQNAQVVGDRLLACADDMGKSDSWLGALPATKYFECSDNRDRIYSLRGLVELDVAESIEVDYNKSLKQIFTLVCLDEITRQRDLEFLSYCNAAASPSWVADLERPWGDLTVDSNAGGNSSPAIDLIEPYVLEAAGVACDEICDEPRPLHPKELVEPLSEFRQRIVDTFLSLVDEESLQDDSVLDQLIMILTYGQVRDYSTQRLHAPEVYSLHSLEDWRRKIRQWISSEYVYGTDNVQKPWEKDDVYLRSLPVGGSVHGCVKTCRGTFIRVPMEARKGDTVAVLLGLSTSIILRRQARENSYLVIGPAYHPDFSAAEAFLGNDFHGWGRLWHREFLLHGFFKEGHSIRYTDPRLDGVPFSDGFEEIVLDDGRPFWGRDGHRDLSVKDPRMSEAALEERGVPLQKFRLL